MIISYQRVKTAMLIPPPEDLVNLFNNLGEEIHKHPDCIQDSNPFDKLLPKTGFCLTATSIQQEYIAFVLGKHVLNVFPAEIMELYFNLDPDYRMQYEAIQGDDIDGCIFVIHQEDAEFDLKKIYESIYHNEEG